MEKAYSSPKKKQKKKPTLTIKQFFHSENPTCGNPNP